ncbi:hypothetical protein BDP55DRAFT_397201 [Colletotrichum godetiae]|uniref:NTF2-like domain-containing protein n=1 Tax=Colletotrichum godetiae TaxID=1209918 RepID=A0AAJ0ABB5_9PEZI|nr:uncharacterized protein BDP55DRAFT_397201 [Colletotrichum godetiae]KAK1658462.1 hypothetical protein BDP55DRAFT_397201 [Colletotrichum godetiae]
MRSFALVSTLLTALAAVSTGSFLSPRRELSLCLCEDEAWDITRQWLGIFSTPGVSSKAELATIVSQNLTSYDDTFGSPTIGIDQLWAALTAGGNATTANVTQAPNFLLHTCDQIAYNWQYTAVTTGYNSTVPVGTPVTFTGNDIIRVDLATRLVSNATSAGNWILLARQLGDSCNV